MKIKASFKIPNPLKILQCLIPIPSVVIKNFKKQFKFLKKSQIFKNIKKPFKNLWEKWNRKFLLHKNLKIRLTQFWPWNWKINLANLKSQFQNNLIRKMHLISTFRKYIRKGNLKWYNIQRWLLKILPNFKLQSKFNN